MIAPPNTAKELELLGQHDDFMHNLNHVLVFENDRGQDSAWWADYQKDKTHSKSLGDFAVSVIANRVVSNEHKRKNLTQLKATVDHIPLKDNSVDFIWSVNALNRSAVPYATLLEWNRVLKHNGMLCVCVPQTAFIDDLSRWQIWSESGSFYHWSMISLIHCLAINGFDCHDGHQKQERHNPWIWAAAYKSEHAPMSPYTTWYELAEKKLLPESLENCVYQFGYARHEFLKVEWFDHSIRDLAIESMP